MKSLIIIDMQPYFAHRYGHTLKRYKSRIKNIINAIKLAKKNKWNIILVEYKANWINQKTSFQIRKALAGYRYTVLFKKCDSAMPVLQNHFNKKKIGNHTLIITGANADACVADTIHDLYTETRHQIYAYSKGIMSFNGKNFNSYANSSKFMRNRYLCSTINTLHPLT